MSRTGALARKVSAGRSHQRLQLGDAERIEARIDKPCSDSIGAPGCVRKKGAGTVSTDIAGTSVAGDDRGSTAPAAGAAGGTQIRDGRLKVDDHARIGVRVGASALSYGRKMSAAQETARVRRVPGAVAGSEFVGGGGRLQAEGPI